MTGLPPLKIFPTDQYFIEKCLKSIPLEFHQAVLNQHAKLYPASRREANLSLLDAAEQHQEKNKILKGFDQFVLDRDQVKKIAEERADICRHFRKNIIINPHCVCFDHEELELLILEQVVAKGSDFVAKWGIEAPKSNWSKKKDYQKCLNSQYLRFIDPHWHEKKIYTKNKRDRELYAIQNGFINRQNNAYISNFAFDHILEMDEISREIMAETKLVCGEDEITLLEAWESSVSNPVNRFAEMVTRLKGMEGHADELGYASKFITITAPSKYHAYLSEGGKNKKYNDKDKIDPRDTHFNLMEIWKKVRAQFSKQGINVMFMRVVEPHHDGTPHYHIVMFGTKDDLQAADKIMQDYFTAEDRDELKDITVRYKSIDIDKNKKRKNQKGEEQAGSAVGYVIKYIAKSINKKVCKEFGKEKDHETGKDILDVSDRVSAWSRLWGIRQFQFGGSASVMVWRELRRWKEKFSDPELEKLRVFAQASDYTAYQKLMGECEVKVVYVANCDKATGELKLSGYEEITKKITGLEKDGEFYKTRTKEWEVIKPEDKSIQALIDQVKITLKPECSDDPLLLGLVPITVTELEPDFSEMF